MAYDTRSSGRIKETFIEGMKATNNKLYIQVVLDSNCDGLVWKWTYSSTQDSYAHQGLLNKGEDLQDPE